MLSSLVNTSQANLTLSNSIDLQGQTKNSFLMRSCQQQKILHSRPHKKLCFCRKSRKPLNAISANSIRLAG